LIATKKIQALFPKQQLGHCGNTNLNYAFTVASYLIAGLSKLWLLYYHGKGFVS